MDDISLLGSYLLLGTCIYSVFHHLTYALHPPRSRTHLLFSGMCLVVLRMISARIEAYQSTSITDFILYQKLTFASAMIFYGLLVWFAAAYTGVRPRKLLGLLTLLFGLLFIFNLTMPLGLQFTEIESLNMFVAPSGRRFVKPIGELSPLFISYLVSVPLVLGFFLYALTLNFRETHKPSTLAMMIAVGLHLLLAIESSLVRTSVIDFVSLGTLGFLLVIVVLGAVLSHETLLRLQESESQLKIQLQEKQKLYEQAKTVNRLKDEFLTTISHELRTPLNVILGNCELLKGDDLTDQEEAQSVDALVRNAKLQERIVDDLLDISGLISGKLRLKTSKVDLRPVIQAAIDATKISAEAKGIAVVTEMDPSVGFVCGDRDRLQQVIWNLLSNAVKFTPQGGSIFIRLEITASQAQVTVRDTGIGMDPEFLPYVFDRFLQEDGKLTRRFGGLGLGLAIARHLIESHGGTIEVSSEGPGKGAKFSVSLPLSRSAICDSSDLNKTTEHC
jgi:signal transduction histidine kinase